MVALEPATGAGDVAVAQAAPGDLDTSFGTSGGFSQLQANQYTTDPFTGWTDVVVDSSGRLVVVGATTDETGDSEMVVARYLANGTHDPSFGTGGVFVHCQIARRRYWRVVPAAIMAAAWLVPQAARAQTVYAVSGSSDPPTSTCSAAVCPSLRDAALAAAANQPAVAQRVPARTTLGQGPIPDKE